MTVTAKPFFPNQPTEALDLEFRMRQQTLALTQEDRLRIYEVFSNALPTYCPTKYRTKEGTVIAEQLGEELSFPSPIPPVKLSHLTFGYEELLKHKYALPGFVEVEPGDVVIDCGAYVGGFSMSACKVASVVHAFEPDAENHRCLVENLRKFDNARSNLAGLYDESRTMTLNVSASSVEHSFLAPDDGVIVETREVPVFRLDDYCHQQGIAKLDFVKIEAEGVEIEVFKGLGSLRPKKIAIDVSPERNGESPAEEFKKIFSDLGYEVRQRMNVLFARLPGLTPQGIPRVIYSLWYQGEEHAPPLVQLCWKRWRELNPGWELRVLTQSDVDELLAPYGLPKDSKYIKTTHQALSDIVRTRLLLQFGGVWTDATVLPLRSLDEWLPEATAKSGFFAFSSPSVPGCILSSWFLAARRGNPLCEAVWNRILEVWDRPRRLVEYNGSRLPDDPRASVSPEVLSMNNEVPYFWFHYTVGYVVERDSAAKKVWDDMQKLPAVPPHALQELCIHKHDCTEEEIQSAAKQAFVQKLSWKSEFPLERIVTALQLDFEVPELTAVPAALLEEVKALRAEVSALKNSTSWRMTAPLRKLRSLF